MVLLKKLFQFLGLNEEINRFLTLGLCNNIVLFLYTLYEKNLLSGIFIENKTNLGFLGRILIVLVSTFCFSKIFKKNGILFQERVLNMLGVVPTIVFFLILLELLFTLSLRAGILTLIGLEVFFFCIAFHLTQYLVCKILFLLLKHLFLFYVFFRSTVNVKRLREFYYLHPSFYDYTLVYIVLQGEKLEKNRAIITLVLFVTMIAVYKLHSLYCCI